MFEILPASEGDLLVIKASGKLKDEDYKDTLIPALDALLAAHGMGRMLVVLAPDFRGWEPSAFMDDLRYGLKHGKEFSRIAVVADSVLVTWGVRLSAPFMKGEMKAFPADAYEQALAWVKA